LISSETTRKHLFECDKGKDKLRLSWDKLSRSWGYDHNQTYEQYFRRPLIQLILGGGGDFFLKLELHTVEPQKMG